MFKEIVTVIGGDLRQAHVANRLAAEGYRVRALLFDEDTILTPGVEVVASPDAALLQAEVVILPLPLSADEVHINAPFSRKKLRMIDCFGLIPCDALVLAGRVTSQIANIAAGYGIELVDYLEREELAVLNAVPTCEGAIAIAMQERATTIFGSKVLIAGFGRIGKVMARVLVAMGAQVTVAARRHSDLAWAQILGCKAVDMADLAKVVSQVELIFNTVPFHVFTEAVLTSFKPECLYIDLASKPGGVDFGMAKDLGIKAIWALSLPGKVAPISAGEIIKDTIMNVMEERRKKT